MNNIKTIHLIAKHAIFFVAVISLFIPMVVLSAQQPNLVPNSSFENDTADLPPADYISYMGNIGAKLTVDGSVGYNGSLQSAKISGATVDAAYVYTIDVLPGEKYRLESFCKQIGDGTASMQIFWKTGDKWSFYTAMPYSGDGDWKKAVIEVTIPAAAITTTLTLRLHIVGQTASSAVWFDNVSIRKL